MIPRAAFPSPWCVFPHFASFLSVLIFIRRRHHTSSLLSIYPYTSTGSCSLCKELFKASLPSDLRCFGGRDGGGVDVPNNLIRTITLFLTSAPSSLALTDVSTRISTSHPANAIPCMKYLALLLIIISSQYWILVGLCTVYHIYGSYGTCVPNQLKFHLLCSYVIRTITLFLTSAPSLLALMDVLTQISTSHRV